LLVALFGAWAIDLQHNRHCGKHRSIRNYISILRCLRGILSGSVVLLFLIDRRQPSSFPSLLLALLAVGGFASGCCPGGGSLGKWTASVSTSSDRMPATNLYRTFASSDRADLISAMVSIFPESFINPS
jgi:hypothetical protein